MDIFNTRKVAELEAEVQLYKDRVRQLEGIAKKLKDTELIVKCLHMYIEDDDAMMEIFEAVEKLERLRRQERVPSDIHTHLRHIDARQQMGAQGAAGMQGGLNQFKPGQIY